MNDVTILMYATIVFTVLLVSISICFSILDRKRFSSQRQYLEARYEHMEERYEMLIHNFMQFRESEYNRKSISFNKGFSDEYDEMRLLIKEVRSLRSDIRRELSMTPTVNSDIVAAQILNAVEQLLQKSIQPQIISKQILAELADQLSPDYLLELRAQSYKSRLHDTSRTLLNVLHVLRTPLSGIKINIQALNDMNKSNDSELEKKYTQIEGAVSLIESGMRTLGAYDDISDGSCDLKDRIQREISLILLTADKKITLNTDAIQHGITFPNVTLDNLLLCLSCIVENAVAYSPDNSEIIIAGTIENSICEVLVTNFGAAIPDEVGENIFLDGVSTREGGHGIGLSLARTIVSDRLNGNISFENLADPSRVVFKIRFEVEP